MVTAQRAVVFVAEPPNVTKGVEFMDESGHTQLSRVSEVPFRMKMAACHTWEVSGDSQNSASWQKIKLCRSSH